jgi:hypothetical protein
MLLWLRPFRIGDFIEVGAIAGTVREMGLFACHLETFDGMFLFAPNSAIWNNPLKNHTRNAGRLVSIDVTVASNADIGRARDIPVAMAEARYTRPEAAPTARLRRKPDWSGAAAELADLGVARQCRRAPAHDHRAGNARARGRRHRGAATAASRPDHPTRYRSLAPATELSGCL